VIRFLNRESGSGGWEMAAPVKVTREEHTAQELRRLAAELKDAGHARRLQAISFVLDGWSRCEAAAFADVDRQTLRDWIERYNVGGASALVTLTSPGRPRLLTPNQSAELHQIVVKGPDLNKDGVIRWRCEDLVQQAVSRLGVPEVHPSTMAKWLHRLRLTKLTARPFHPGKDEAAQRAFKENFSTIVNEKLPAAVKDNGMSIEFWFQDEARIGQQGTLSRVWAPVGSRPAMVRDNRRANAYIYGAICPGRGIGAALIMASANTEAMNEHLKEISSQVATGAHAALLCDGAGWHAKSKELVVPSNITLITLPPYSPELNPMENVWEFLRDNRFGAQVWKNYGEIVRACSKAWNWFVSDPLRIASIGIREWVIL
jgi:transposase